MSEVLCHLSGSKRLLLSLEQLVWWEMIIWRIAYQKKLWGLDSQRRTSGHIKVTNQNCMKWGVCGNSKNAALRLMEKAGLIRLDTTRGRSPIVQIIDAELRGPVT